MNSFHNLTKNYPMFSLNKTISSMNTIIDKNKDCLDIDLDYILSKKEMKKEKHKEYDCDMMEEGNSDIEEINIDIEDFTYYIDYSQKISMNSNSIFTKFSWNGAELIDRWELQRTIDYDKASGIANEMIRYYKKNKEFLFTDPIHIGQIRNEELENNNKYYIIDGQHRLEAIIAIYKCNKYPIQKVPCIIWVVRNDNDIDELFDKINNRIFMDSTKLMKNKLILTCNLMEEKWNKDIWGERRPRISKELFIDKIRNNDDCYKLSAEEIIAKIVKINNNLRILPRQERGGNLTIKIHEKAEDIDFFLGIDKKLDWIDKIKIK
jgi:hypothetical protein